MIPSEKKSESFFRIQFLMGSLQLSRIFSQPELTYISACDIDSATDSIDEYIKTGFFKSLDVCGGENIRPFEAFIPLYRKAEHYGLTKIIHVGESGSADDVRKAVEVLGLDEVHHGIGAATSKDTMRFLADNHI